jgi:two-component system, sensor histidine kinase PdtaS
MNMAERYERLPTTSKLLLILTAVLLPIGLALAWIGDTGIRQANAALEGHKHDQSRAAAGAIESLIARNALGLRVAAAGALRNSPNDPCAAAAQALATAPAITRDFALRSTMGDALCTNGRFADGNADPLVAPGDIRAWVDPAAHEIDIRIGVVGGMVTASVPMTELVAAARDNGVPIAFLQLRGGDNALTVVGSEQATGGLSITEWPIGNGNVVARVGIPRQRIRPIDRLLLLLPLLMWIAAALITWTLVSRLLIRPLRRLQRAVQAYRPGEHALELPRKLGPSKEIQELRNAFGRAIERAEESEHETTSALEGQRRLVREVHHRVKNNLQVVASLLNIHGRNANTAEARAAYAGISRRVSALSIVHRNHFAEMEENRGIAVRPLVSELAAELRAGAPESARKVTIELDLDSLYTTQDVAVAVAFLVTEIVEFAMLRAPENAVEISLRRTSDLTGRLELSSPILVQDAQDDPEKVQFERIVGGLAQQLRSTLERKVGRYSVDLPVFPPA